MKRWLALQPAAKAASVALALVPGALGYIAASRCPMRASQGSAVPFKPPGWVFGVVWPLLYLALGVAWSMTAFTGSTRAWWRGAPYVACVAALTAYLPLRACAANRRKEALWAVAAAALAAAYCMEVSEPAARLLLLPLVAWLMFATLLSAAEMMTR